MYYLNKKAFEFIKMLKKSKRGEYEITDLLNMYFKKNLKLNEIHLGRGITWFDMGSYDDFINASSFIKIIEERQNLKIGSVEQAAKLVKFIK
jgi:glucose-1-phosphate thymidylyltransferase